MKDIQKRKIICTIMLITKDSVKLLLQCLIATILASVCIENGWILSDYTTDVSYDMFWRLYSSIFLLVPFIMFYRGITGKYKVEIKVHKDEPSLDVKQILEEDDIESNKCDNNR